MDPRLTFVTLAVRDVDAARRFYVDGLGWEPELEAAGEVLMIRVGERLVLSLWSESGFVDEVGPIRRGEGHSPFTLAHNVATRDDVDTVLAEARAAGASRVDQPIEREWGGYSGYFADPDGHLWEVCWNPDPIGLSVLPD
jgi:catechol 2,3-dioxygenase-like lactoylglutathione lyase family enzyme